MRALVTGGAGFIGSVLVDRLLAEGHEVDVVDDLSTGTLRNLAEARASGGTMKFHQIDVRAPELQKLFERRAPEVVFHLAARAGEGDDAIEESDVNILGSLRVLESARAASVRKVVFAASGSALYGELEPDSPPASELGPQRPSSREAVAKKAVVDYLSLYRERHGLEFTALALAEVYGPRAERGVVSAFAEHLLAGRAATVFGDGRQTRDFVFVDDAVDAFAKAAGRGSGLLLNVGTAKETSLNELHALLSARVGGAKALRRAKARPGDLRRSVLDVSRARIHLGWTPWTALPEGLDRVVAFCSEPRSSAGQRP